MVADGLPSLRPLIDGLSAIVRRNVQGVAPPMPRTISPPPAFLAAFLSAVMTLCAPAAGEEPYGRFQFDESDRDHWSFMPPRRPEVPAVKDTAWVRNPIDAFVLARLEEEKLTPNPSADRLTLLRARLSGSDRPAPHASRARCVFGG